MAKPAFRLTAESQMGMNITVDSSVKLCFGELPVCIGYLPVIRAPRVGVHTCCT